MEGFDFGIIAITSVIKKEQSSNIQLKHLALLWEDQKQRFVSIVKYYL